MSASSIVRRQLEAFLAGPPSQLKLISAKHQALPVYSDLGGSLLITPELEILALDSDNQLAPLSEKSEQWRLVALVSAAEKFPDLKCLLPVRPADAPECSSCAGHGWVVQYGFRCGECCGLGWQARTSS